MRTCCGGQTLGDLPCMLSWTLAGGMVTGLKLKKGCPTRGVWSLSSTDLINVEDV